MSDKEHRSSEQLLSDRLVPAPGGDRRYQARENVGLRPVKIIAGGGEHSFFIRNISPRGVMGQTSIVVVPGQVVRLQFENGTIVPATVRWTRGSSAGLQFIRPGGLQQTLAVGSERKQREPRHRTSRSAVVVSGDTYRVVNIGNISRGGAQVEASLEPGYFVTVSFAGGPSVSCQVRWTKDGRSGLMFARHVNLGEFS
jgi:hypothetical protein